VSTTAAIVAASPADPELAVSAGNLQPSTSPSKTRHPFRNINFDRKICCESGNFTVAVKLGSSH